MYHNPVISQGRPLNLRELCAGILTRYNLSHDLPGLFLFSKNYCYEVNKSGDLTALFSSLVLQPTICLTRLSEYFETFAKSFLVSELVSTNTLMVICASMARSIASCNDSRTRRFSRAFFQKSFLVQRLPLFLPLISFCGHIQRSILVLPYK